MPHLNPFALSGLLIVVTYLPLFLFIFIKGKTKLSKIYSFHVFSVFAWGLGSFFIGITTNHNTILNITNFAFMPVIFIPVFFQHAVLRMTRNTSKLYISFIYGQAIFFIIFLFRNKMFGSFPLMFNSFYFPTSTQLYIYCIIIWQAIVLIAHAQLIYYYKRAYPNEKEQLKTLILAATTGFLGGTSNFLPVLGFNIYPLGNFLIPFHSIIFAYAILKHQFLDIKIAVKKGIIYTIFLLIISILYLILVLASEKFIQNALQYQSAAVSIFIAFLIGVIFFPLRNKIQYITEKYFFKGSQSEIAEQNELLRQEIAQSEKYKTLSTLTTGIAHEIKNPLTAIKTFAEYLPHRLQDKEFLSKFSDIVGREVNRIDEMVHQLLEYGKPAALSIKEINIHKLINDTADILNSKFIGQKINVERRFYAQQTLLLPIDPNQLRQALLNILLNAIEAMPGGGQMKIETQQLKNNFEIIVSDTGFGITKEDLPQIFDPFFSKKDHGTGLGLSITQSLIENHSGTIEVRSAVGAGTEIKIKLPLVHIIPTAPGPEAG